MIIVSACLAGMNCAYDGKSRTCNAVVELVKNGEAIPVCPEQLGGLSTPRNPVEIVAGRVKDRSGKDFTLEFEIGALEVLKIAQLCGAETAILKSRSPSCGHGQVYDGSFNHTLTDSDGFTAALLKAHGISVLDETNVICR